eukprot:1160552-Pelagomonas_calceolata.AAC.2
MNCSEHVMCCLACLQLAGALKASNSCSEVFASTVSFIGASLHCWADGGCVGALLASKSCPLQMRVCWCAAGLQILSLANEVLASTVRIIGAILYCWADGGCVGALLASKSCPLQMRYSQAQWGFLARVYTVGLMEGVLMRSWQVLSLAGEMQAESAVLEPLSLGDDSLGRYANSWVCEIDVKHSPCKRHLMKMELATNRPIQGRAVETAAMYLILENLDKIGTY